MLDEDIIVNNIILSAMLHKFHYETTLAKNGKKDVDVVDVYSGDNDDIVEYTYVLGAKHSNGRPYKWGAAGLIRLWCLPMEEVLPLHWPREGMGDQGRDTMLAH